MKNIIEERRRYARVSIKSKVFVGILQGRKKDEFRAIGTNLSAEGMLFISNRKLKKGAKLVLKINLPKKNDILDIEGEVRWSKLAPKMGKYPPFYDTGVKFDNVPSNHLKTLIKYVCGTKAADLLSEIQ